MLTELTHSIEPVMQRSLKYSGNYICN